VTGASSAVDINQEKNLIPNHNNKQNHAKNEIEIRREKTVYSDRHRKNQEEACFQKPHPDQKVKEKEA